MKKQYRNVLLSFGVLSLLGVGCLGQVSETTTERVSTEQKITDCTASIDISQISSDDSRYQKATFTYPCDWENTSSATTLSLTSPDKKTTLQYPSEFEGGLPFDGTEQNITIAGQVHRRYIVKGNLGTSELISGPVVDMIARPYYRYPNDSKVGDQMANIFASLRLE